MPAVLAAHLSSDPSPKQVSALGFPLVSFVPSNEERTHAVLGTYSKLSIIWRV